MNSPATMAAIVAGHIECFHLASVHCSCQLLDNVPGQLHSDLVLLLVDPCMLAAVDTVAAAASILMAPEEQHCGLPAVPALECESAAENEINYL